MSKQIVISTRKTLQKSYINNFIDFNSNNYNNISIDVMQEKYVEL